MKTIPLLYTLTLACAALPAAGQAAGSADSQAIERGRYLLITGGCNDCHTPGYMELEGDVPEPVWLTGNRLGFQGPWGTTYPANLRLLAQQVSETQWLERARRPTRPPMPWFNLRAMTDPDLVAMYRYLRHAGPAGEPAPAAAAPGVAVSTPYFDFTPKNLPPQQATNKRGAE